MGGPDDDYGQDDEVVAEVLSYKEQEVDFQTYKHSVLILLLLLSQLQRTGGGFSNIQTFCTNSFTFTFTFTFSATTNRMWIFKHTNIS